MTTSNARTRSRNIAALGAIKTILVPVDFSPPSLKALASACALAKKFRAKIHLIHVNELAVQEPLLAPTFSLASDSVINCGGVCRRSERIARRRSRWRAVTCAAAKRPSKSAAKRAYWTRI